MLTQGGDTLYFKNAESLHAFLKHPPVTIKAKNLNMDPSMFVDTIDSTRLFSYFIEQNVRFEYLGWHCFGIPTSVVNYVLWNRRVRVLVICFEIKRDSIEEILLSNRCYLNHLYVHPNCMRVSCELSKNNPMLSIINGTLVNARHRMRIRASIIAFLCIFRHRKHQCGPLRILDASIVRQIAQWTYWNSVRILKIKKIN